MYVGLYAICVWNWNWWFTRDHFLIKRWSQHKHRCSAPVVGLEEYSLGLVRDTNLAWVRPVLHALNFCSALWILLIWCFSTRVPVATVLRTQPVYYKCIHFHPSIIPQVLAIWSQVYYSPCNTNYWLTIWIQCLHLSLCFVNCIIESWIKHLNIC